MAKEKKDEVYVCSGIELFERRKKRDILTSTLSTDIGLNGGIPMGCTVLLGGKQKTGKSTTALGYAAEAQEKYGSKVFYANVEGRLDNKILSQIKKLDLKNLEVIMGPAITDKQGNVIGNRKMSAQQWWTKIGEIITNNPRSVIIVDSVSALSEEAEIAEGMGHMSRGGLQKLESQFVRQYGDLIVPNNITLFLLAQVQANTSGYGDPIQIKCGNSIRFMADAIIFVKGVEKWKPNADGRILGHDMIWKIECSPLGAPFIDTKVPLRYGEGLDYARDVMLNAINWEIIKPSGSWYILPFKEEDSKIVFAEDGDIKVQGEENVRTWLVEHPDCLNKVDKTLRSKFFE